ncbi:MAG: peptidylprolyl isomerase [Gammaproteobacteria bacterium]|nr:peptidylprolyl isomerase [Gammaproteobacteria bacterium]
MRAAELIGGAVFGAALLAAGAAATLWYTGRSSTTTQPEVASASPAAAVTTRDSVSQSDIEQLLSVLDAEQRARVVGTAEQFAQFVEQEAASQSIIRAATANKVEQNPRLRELMERAAMRVLGQGYLNQVIAANMEAGFPTDDQIKQYFDANAAQFMLPERVHLWQIYFPLSADADADAVADAEKLANSVALALKQGKANFAEEAAKYSAHVQSRLSDGYMGLLKVDDLLPEIRAEVENLAENAISKPIRSNSGFHIVRRGAVVKGQPLKLQEVAGQIRLLLRRDAEARVRQAVISKIRETYPTSYAADDLERWRAALAGAGR